MTTIELAVEEVFAFGDGRTVFAGLLSEPLRFRRFDKADLVIDGIVVASLRLNIEMPLRPSNGVAFSVSTMDTLPLDPKAMPRGTCLRLHQLAETTPDSPPHAPRRG